MIKGNSGTKIEQLTAEAINKSFVQVTEDMRLAAKQAREQADKLEKEADELSQMLIERGSSFAAKIGALIERCRVASDSFREHRDALSELHAEQAAKTTGPIAENSETAREIARAMKKIEEISTE